MQDIAKEKADHVSLDFLDTLKKRVCRVSKKGGCENKVSVNPGLNKSIILRG